MSIKWKDTTSYRKGTTEKPNVYEWQGESLKIVIVRKHINYPENWTMTCYELGFDNKFLISNNEPFSFAEYIAINIIREKLDGMRKEVWKLVANLPKEEKNHGI